MQRIPPEQIGEQGTLLGLSPQYPGFTPPPNNARSAGGGQRKGQHKKRKTATEPGPAGPDLHIYPWLMEWEQVVAFLDIMNDRQRLWTDLLENPLGTTPEPSGQQSAPIHFLLIEYWKALTRMRQARWQT